jgi:Na+-translocating ferredoxin:NAD+ oxidoreductase subunit C
MTGRALPDDAVPLAKTMNCIVAATDADLRPPAGPELPCIRCGDCARVCPAVLLPQQLHRAVMSGDDAAAERFGLADCIECGCCDYVCPSQIPLVERFRDMKPALAAQLAARVDADAARARFDARTERLERIENERDAVLARKRQELAKKSS